MHNAGQSKYVFIVLDTVNDGRTDNYSFCASTSLGFSATFSFVVQRQPDDFHIQRTQLQGQLLQLWMVVKYP